MSLLIVDTLHLCTGCNSEFCIDTDLVCDEVNHCGDSSDEASSAICTRKNTLSTTDRDSNLDLPVIGSPIYCESSTLDYAATEVANELGTVFGMSSLIFVVVIVSSLLVLCAAIVGVTVCLCRRTGGRPMQTAQQPPPNTSYPCETLSYPTAGKRAIPTDQPCVLAKIEPTFADRRPHVHRCWDPPWHVERSRLDRCFSAPDVRVERVGPDGDLNPVPSREQAAALPGRHVRVPGSGKLASPCRLTARVQRGPGPPLLPGKVRSEGSDRGRSGPVPSRVKTASVVVPSTGRRRN
uniref:Uncharacterized protein n=1 Tax=Timema bartmani TaxID=61472 RepID=A0A7R9EPQ3_9NEOP|nr:unnamed protein product [Timema bartmani]